LTAKATDNFFLFGFSFLGHDLTISCSTSKIKLKMEKLVDGLFLFWLIGLTGLIFWLTRKYQKITKDFSIEGFKSAADLTKRVVQLEDGLIFSLRKIGLVRFNPFPGTGGDQSFSLAVMDEKNNGVVITSLHHRESTRLYAKEIKEGQAVKQELAEEEKKAIKIASKIGKGKNEK
jgi:hypothetical protein